MSEKRKFSRIPFKTECSLSCDGRGISSELLDISLKGALLHTGQQEVETGSAVSLAIYLVGLEIPMIFDGIVTHAQSGKLGIYFSTTDIESMIHLRRVLEINSLDPDRIVDELGNMIKDE